MSVEGRTHKPVIDHNRCETCAVCLQACPAETIPSMRLEEESLRGRVYDHSDLTPRIRPEKGFDLPRCQSACPIRQDVRGYMRLIAQKQYREALELIRETNPLPSVCGYVCHHPCEAACTRGRVDDPLSIKSLKRFLAEYDEGNLRPYPTEKPRSKKVVVVGSGPAGITAAHVLARRGYEVEIIESYSEPGGLLAWAIPEFRLPREVLKRDIEYMKRMGVEFRTNTSFGRDVTWDDLDKGHADAVVIATGTQKSLKMHIRNEDADQRRPLAFFGHFDCLSFLRRFNEGEEISLGPRVLVVGGGNAALDSARSALRLGAREVTIVYRRGPLEMPADKEEIDDAVKEGVKIQFLTAPVRMIVENGRIKGLECIRTELKESDSSRRRRPVPIEGSEFVLRAETVIAAVGQEPDYDLVGPIMIDRENLKTSRKNVFVAGDFVNGSTTVVDAMASGRKVALAVDAYLEGGDR